jgi:hypothetical protein
VWKSPLAAVSYWNSLGWNDFVTSHALHPCKNYCGIYSILFFGILIVVEPILMMTVNWSPVHNANFLSLIFTLSLNWVCCVLIWCTIIPELSVSGGQALSSEHLSSIKQFLLCWETSVTCYPNLQCCPVSMFLDTLGRSANLLIPQISIALEWLVLCTWVFMLKKNTAHVWLALCFVHCVLGVGATLTYRFFADLMMLITGKMIYIINFIFVSSKT